MDKKTVSFFISNKKNQRSNSKNERQNFQNKTERQKKFDNNRNGLQKKDKDETEKKPFDKKTYRLKKYSKKYKLDQWEEQRKKKMLHEYQKSIKDDPVSGNYTPKLFDDDVPDSSTEAGRFVKHPDLINKENKNVDQSVKVKKNPFQKAKEQYNKIQQEKLEKKQKIEKSKEERKQKLQEYKKQKHERFKKLSKKNKKGQPIMTGRLELLLDKIQKGT